MEKETSDKILKRIFKISIFIQFFTIILIYIFTKTAFCSILFLLGSIISLIGFFLMIKMIDKVLYKQKGYSYFFMVGLSKMAIISGVFYFISRLSRSAVLFYMLGLSMVVAAIMAEAVYQFYRSFINGRA